MQKILLIIFVLAGCKSPSYQWVKADKSDYEKDIVTCEARAYEVAGPRPEKTVSGLIPPALAAKARYEKESVSHWENAFDAGLRACMYEKGYSD